MEDRIFLEVKCQFWKVKVGSILTFVKLEVGQLLSSSNSASKNIPQDACRGVEVLLQGECRTILLESALLQLDRIHEESGPVQIVKWEQGTRANQRRLGVL